MTTAELYHALDGSGYEHDVCWRKTAAFHLRMPVAASSYRSPQCGIRDLIRRRLVDRIAHAPRVGMDRSVLFIRPARLQCRRCQRVLTGALPGMEPRCKDTKNVATIVVDLRKMMTIRDGLQWMGVSEGMIRSIDQPRLPKRFGKPRV